MKGHGFIAYLFQTMLHEHFHTKALMANALGVQLRTLQYNFKNFDNAKGGSVALQNLLLYCYENDFSVDEMYRHYNVAALKEEFAGDGVGTSGE